MAAAEKCMWRAVVSCLLPSSFGGDLEMSVL
jgi:hypothetical protein